MKIVKEIMVVLRFHMFGSLAKRSIRKLLRMSKLSRREILFTSLFLSLSVISNPNQELGKVFLKDF